MTFLESEPNLKAADDDGCIPLTFLSRKSYARVVEILTKNRNYDEAANEHKKYQLTKFWKSQDNTDKKARHRYQQEKAYFDSVEEEADLESLPIKG